MAFKEIKEAFDARKLHADPDQPACKINPFTHENNWMHHYLFPEVLLCFDDYVSEMYEKYVLSFSAFKGCFKTTFEAFKLYYTVEKHYLMFGNLSAVIFPCWICSEEQVLRVMAECDIIE